MSEFTKSQFETLFAYRWHITHRLLERAAQLSAADYHANPGYGHGSIHDLFFHLLRADCGWRQALETGQQPPPLSAADYPTLTALQAALTVEQAAMEKLIGRLTSEELEGNINLTTRRGDVMPFPRWRVLQHLVLHGMQHQTEIAQLLTAKGQSPGDLDFIFYR